MKNKVFNLAVCGLIVTALLCCFGCDNSLDIQQSYPFTVETMPVQTEIAKGETAEIGCELISEGQYDDAVYTIRFFQTEGKGSLRMEDGTVLTANDRYPLSKKIFRLYYTSASTDQQKIDIYVEDNFGQVVQLTFSFTNITEDTDEPDGGRRSRR
jgi:hypothetical protein